MYQSPLSIGSSIVVSAMTIAVLILSIGHSESAEAQRRCLQIADLGNQSCKAEAIEEYYARAAVCTNLRGDARSECSAENAEEFSDSQRECRKVRRARKNLCPKLNVDTTANGLYRPQFADFIEPNQIASQPNPYLPLQPGNIWVYADGEETETITVEVKTATKQIEDATCVVVTDVVRQDFTEDEFTNSPVFGAVIEQTDDWFAQDVDGNVIYCGEISLEAEPQVGDSPILPSEILGSDGSWKWGRDGALAGYVMFANPIEGAVYRSEYLFGEAEDVAEIVRASYVHGTGDALDDIIPDETLDLMALCANGCVVVIDSTPLEPGAVEYKFYAPGIGMILEVKPDDEEPEFVQLIGCSVPGSNCPPLN